jgi:aminopeptidase N
LKFKSTLDDGLSVCNANTKKTNEFVFIDACIGKFEKSVKNQNQNFLEMYLEKKTQLNLNQREIQNGCLIFRKGNRVKFWGIYKQAPVRDFLYAGMENTSATLFNTRVVDSTGLKTEVTQIMHMN